MTILKNIESKIQRPYFWASLITVIVFGIFPIILWITSWIELRNSIIVTYSIFDIALNGQKNLNDLDTEYTFQSLTTIPLQIMNINIKNQLNKDENISKIIVSSIDSPKSIALQPVFGEQTTYNISLTVETSDHKLIITKLPKIPSTDEINIFICGEILEMPFKQVEIVSDNDSIKYIHEANITGFPLFIAKNYWWIPLAIFCIFLWEYLAKRKR